MPSPIDLHSHSTVSDGLLPPDALMLYAYERGVRLMALTDHDDVDGLLPAAAQARKIGMQFINGVEISVTWNRRTLHIVGLRIDPEHTELRAGLQGIRDSRHNRARGMADSLAKVGITGSLEGAYAHATQDGIITRSHFARFLVEKGFAKSVGAVFKRFLVKGKPGYIEHRWASLEEAVGWINASGGTAVLAHPGRYDLGRTNMLTLLHEFREMGGKGIEVVTGSHTPEMVPHFARLAHQFDLLASAGSDYHGPGQSYFELGLLPDLPAMCTPVWHDWEEIGKLN